MPHKKAKREGSDTRAEEGGSPSSSSAAPSAEDAGGNGLALVYSQVSGGVVGVSYRMDGSGDMLQGTGVSHPFFAGK